MERLKIAAALVALLVGPAFAVAPGWVLDRPEDVSILLAGTPLPLRTEARTAAAGGELAFTQTAETPGGGRLEVRRQLSGEPGRIVESWRLQSDSPLTAPLEVCRVGRLSDPASAVTVFRRDGWARPEPLAGGVVNAEYRFADMLADVPAGPAWLHDIAMVHYDYLSGSGEGWERDTRALAAWLPPEQRRRVALCFHGWYDTLGRYTYDQATDRLDERWIAMARTRKVALSREEMRRRLEVARDLGFRVLIYFADGLLQDSGAAGYQRSWDFVGPAGQRISGWQGPDTWGTTYARNPANPAVSAWYLGYLRALIRAFGDVTDGFVWDETFYLRAGAIAQEPAPAYADRAMLDLVAELARVTTASNPQLAFLASDCTGIGSDIPGYAMVAHGTYQDTACAPSAWSYGLLPNWRNTLWSCNWYPFSRLGDTRFGVRHYGTPVAVSAGWEDDRGPSKWTVADCRAILGLLAERLTREPVRYLTGDPATVGTWPVAASDAIPMPAHDEVNWALRTEGAQACASSNDTYAGLAWAADWVLDGVRDDTGWCRDHGWASAADQPLPQWLEVRFGQPRTIRRFVVVTYDKPGTSETCGKWGILDYELQVPDGDGWRSVVVEGINQAKGVRVHRLAEALKTSTFRILVRSVAALDGQARLLQLEAWGAR